MCTTEEELYIESTCNDYPLTELQEQNNKAYRRSSIVGKHKKHGCNDRHAEVIKYGTVVPRNVIQALELDKQNENSLWSKAIETEIQTLIDLGCFDFKEKTYRPGSSYQYAPIRLFLYFFK